MYNPSDILNDYLKGSYKSSINEEIARYFIAYLIELPNLKLTEVAEKCHVSTSTVIRFCRELGFLDFTDFKKYVEETNISNKSEGAESVFLKNPQDIAARKNRIDVINSKVKDSISLLNFDKIDKLTKDIFNYRYVYIFGSSLSILVGEYLRIQLVRFNKSISTLSLPKMDVPLTPDKEDTLGIVLTQHSRYFRQSPDFITYLQRNCSKTWLITQDRLDKGYKKYFDDALFVNGSEDMFVEYHIMLDVSEIIAELYSRNAEK